ncbi:alpha/beta fold hydrolase [Paenarthrobacter sp. NPDC057981]|uniref:alpha/beta fold hydrolase n=1 Tax=Paenarthrobacter sp. NPDC057981 TaxID=3346297 RepID=UPI0036DDF643
MSPQILTQEWIESAVEDALRDGHFSQRVRAFTASLHVADEKEGFTISFRPDGKFQVVASEEAIADFVLKGTRQQWESALESARDLGSATANGLTLHGDPTELAGHAVALSRLWLALQGNLAPRKAAPEEAGTQATNPTREVTGRYVDVKGFRTYYETAGTGRPIVCIHSGGADGREYRHLLPFLASLGYEAIAVDFPGHGKSYPDLTNLAPIRDLTEWIDFLLDFSAELGLDKPIYVGCAMSGSLLLELAATHPDASRAIVSTIGTVDYTDGLSDEFLDGLNHPKINVSDFLEAVTPGLIGPNLPTQAGNEATWHNARNLTPEVMDADLRIYARHNVRSRLHQISIPVLHIRTEFDPSVRDQDVEAIAAEVPTATLVSLPGVGHLPMVENPGLYNSTVEDYLRILDNSDQLAHSRPSLSDFSTSPE